MGEWRMGGFEVEEGGGDGMEAVGVGGVRNLRGVCGSCGCVSG